MPRRLRGSGGVQASGRRRIGGAFRAVVWSGADRGNGLSRQRRCDDMRRSAGSAHPMTDTLPDDEVPSARALLKERDYLLFWGTRWTGSFASQIQSVAMGWQMYELARRGHSVNESALLVSMLGLAAFLPVLLLTLPAGEAADRYDRKKVLLLCLAGETISVFILAMATVQGWTSPALLMGIAALFGASRAFFAPANTALGPMLVPRKLLPRAIAWNSLAWQTASILGPAAGGILVARSSQTAYFTTFGLYGVAAV